MINWIAKLNPHLVLGLAVLIVGLLALEGWMLALRKPYAEYQAIKSTHASLLSALRQSPDQSSELSKLSTELKVLTEQLSGELHQIGRDTSELQSR